MSLDLKEHSLPLELAAVALRELNETPTTRREGLRELRRRVAEIEDADDTLVVDSAFLLRFLRCKKFDVSRSFSVYQGYCRFRSENADMFDDLDPSSVRHVWDDGVIGALSARDKKGRSVMVGFPGRWDPCDHSLEDALRVLVLQLEHLIVSEETQVNGIVLIADFKDFSLYQARCLRPWYFQMMTSLVQIEQCLQGFQSRSLDLMQLHTLKLSLIPRPQLHTQLLSLSYCLPRHSLEAENAFPARFKGVYIVNQPWYISILLSLLRPFLSEKMNSRIHLLGSNIEDLHEHFSSETLPQELGGSLPPYEGKEWARTIIDAHKINKSEVTTPKPIVLKSRESVV